MKFFKIALLAAMLVTSSSLVNADAVQTGSTITIGGGDGVIIGTPLYNDPIIKTRTISLGGSAKIIFTNKTYNWYNTNNLAMRSSAVQLYNRDGAITREYGNEYFYEPNGKPFGVYYRHSFDTSYRYNKQKQLVSSLCVSAFYNAKNKLLWKESTSKSYLYNSDGTLKQEETAFKRTDKKGIVLDSCRTMRDYTYCANGDSYVVDSFYGSDGKIRTKSVAITIVNGDGSKKYSVCYDLDQNGQVTYTHVFENAGIIVVTPNVPSPDELTDVSGQGYRLPADIIYGIRNPVVDDEGSPYKIHVDGNITFVAETLDLGSNIIEASGNVEFIYSAGHNDIIVDGNMTITGDKIDLSDFNKITVTGDLAIDADSWVKLGVDTIVEVGGMLNILSGSIITDTSTLFTLPADDISVDGSTMNIIANGNENIVFGNFDISEGSTITIVPSNPIIVGPPLTIAPPLPVKSPIVAPVIVPPVDNGKGGGFGSGLFIAVANEITAKNAVIQSANTNLPEGVSMSGELVMQGNAESQPLNNR